MPTGAFTAGGIRIEDNPTAADRSFRCGAFVRIEPKYASGSFGPRGAASVIPIVSLKSLAGPREGILRSLAGLGGAGADFIPRPLHLAIARFGRQANQIHVALIAPLARENQISMNPPNPPGHWGEDYMNYYGDLIEAIGTLGDPRAIRPLADAITTGADAAAPLASLGGAALPSVLPKAQSRDLLVRNAALGVLVAMLSPLNRPQLSEENVMEIAAIFRTAVNDPNFHIRGGALQVLPRLAGKGTAACWRRRRARTPICSIGSLRRRLGRSAGARTEPGRGYASNQPR